MDPFLLTWIIIGVVVILLIVIIAVAMSKKKQQRERELAEREARRESARGEAPRPASGPWTGGQDTVKRNEDARDETRGAAAKAGADAKPGADAKAGADEQRGGVSGAAATAGLAGATGAGVAATRGDERRETATDTTEEQGGRNGRDERGDLGGERGDAADRSDEGRPGGNLLAGQDKPVRFRDERVNETLAAQRRDADRADADVDGVTADRAVADRASTDPAAERDVAGRNTAAGLGGAAAAPEYRAHTDEGQRERADQSGRTGDAARVSGTNDVSDQATPTSAGAFGLPTVSNDPADRETHPADREARPAAQERQHGVTEARTAGAERDAENRVLGRDEDRSVENGAVRDGQPEGGVRVNELGGEDRQSREPEPQGQEPQVRETEVREPQGQQTPVRETQGLGQRREAGERLGTTPGVAGERVDEPRVSDGHAQRPSAPQTPAAGQQQGSTSSRLARLQQKGRELSTRLEGPRQNATNTAKKTFTKVKSTAQTTYNEVKRRRKNGR